MICRYCGSEFEPKKRGRKNTGFCCKHCADNWRKHNKYDLMPKKYTRVCAQCGTEFQTNSKNQKYCSRECGFTAKRTGRTTYVKTCLYCGQEFQTIHKDHKYCTSTCASRDAGDKRRGDYSCEYCGKPRWSDHPNRNRFCSRECVNKAKRLETLLRHTEAQKEREEKLTRKCPNCGITYMAKQSNQVFCSEKCQYEATLRTRRRLNQEKFIPKLRICPHCGKNFATTLQAQDKQYCSDWCRNRAAHARGKEIRREQMKNAFIEPVGLKTTYRSYKGKCAICGLPVPETSEPSNQWAATVDHVVPLSKGGFHEKGNCQLAHRLCNSLKLDAVEEFKIDWTQMLKDEPGRWNEQLDGLWIQLGIEEDCTA